MAHKSRLQIRIDRVKMTGVYNIEYSPAIPILGVNHSSFYLAAFHSFILSAHDAISYGTFVLNMIKPNNSCMFKRQTN